MSRILALPIVLITFMAFTIKSKDVAKPDLKINKEITVVIDAGHGYNNGKFSGAFKENIKEDDINLAIAKYVKELNRNKLVHIILTRDNNEDVNLKQRVEIAKESHADLFLSIHVNAGFNNESGMEVVVSDRNVNQKDDSRRFASALVEEIQKEYSINKELQIKQNGIYVLDKSPCPSAMIECGYITNEKDRNFISNETNQKLIAGKILKALELYENSPNSIRNTVQPDENKSANSLSSKDTTKPDPLLVIDGKVIGKFNAVKTNLDTDPQNIESMNVLTGETAKKKYGIKGKNGVIEIISKNPNKPILIKNGNRNTSGNINQNQNTESNILKGESKNKSGNLNQNTEPISIKGENVNSTSDNIDQNTGPIFTKEETEAKIDKDVWIKYLEEHLQPIINELSKTIPSGKYSVMIQLLIDKEGKVTNVKALNDPGYNISIKVANMIATSSPKWDPAIQNGKAVNSYHNQPLTLVIGKG